MARKRDPSRVTIRAVAKAAGVSPATASNVLTGKRQVHSTAGRRVLDAAQRMGYQREDRKEFKRAIHFVLYKKHGHVVMDTPFFSALIQGIEKTCRSNGFSLSLTYIDRVKNAGSDALIRQIVSDAETPLLLLATEMDEADLLPFSSFQGPMVVVDNHCPMLPLHTVSIDNGMAGWAAGNCLLSHGHRQVGFITSSIPFQNAKDRQRGLSEALASKGLRLAEQDIFSVTPTLEEATRELTALFSGRRELPTAMFAMNDILAFAAYRALQETGRRIPDDVSLIGMDNLPFGQIVTPQLTTIGVHKEELGHQAVEQLIHIVKGNVSVPVKLSVSVSLIERGSVCNCNREACTNENL